jgi:NADH-quinone oxidoreductase subunit N
MTDLVRIAPEAILLLSALLALFADSLTGGRDRAAAWIGAAGAAIAAAVAWFAGRGGIALFGESFAIDGAAQVARTATGLLAAVFLVWLAATGLRRGGERTFTALVLFAALGAMLMSAARDWIVLLLSLEVATMPAYVLMGFERNEERSLEGALKYFLLSMVASALFFYGLSFVIGMSGSTALAATKMEPGLIGAVAAAFVLAGLLAKLSAAPFQWWAPDAYAGAPAASVAFVSAVPKVAGLLAFARVTQVIAPQVPSVQLILIGGALLSMLIGNLAAYPQTDLRRLMAYSGVAHAGYLLVGLAAGGSGLSAALLYAIAYAVPSMGVMLVVAHAGNSIIEIRGLASRMPWAAWSVVIMLLSLIGVPPLAGFIGKLALFTAAIGGRLTWLAVVAVAMSAVSAGFYLRIVRAMFFEQAPLDEGAPAAAEAPGLAKAMVLVCAAATVLVGVASSPLLAAIVFAKP